MAKSHAVMRKSSRKLQFRIKGYKEHRERTGESSERLSKDLQMEQLFWSSTPLHLSFNSNGMGSIQSSMGTEPSGATQLWKAWKPSHTGDPEC